MRFLLSINAFILLSMLPSCGRFDGQGRGTTRSLQSSSDFLKIGAPAPISTNLEESGPINIRGQANVLISHKRITNPNGPCITIDSSAWITIESSSIGPCAGEAIAVSKSSDIVVRDNYIEKARAGLYAYKSQQIKFQNNYVKNVVGGRPRGQMVQFNEVNGEGNLIQHNIAINIMNESEPEDVINLYRSNGTAGSPILVRNNYIQGGGPSKFGGGIMLGDSGGSNQQAIGNIVVDPGQYGIAIASGNGMHVADNQVFARQQFFTNVGLYAWDQTNGGCHDISFVNNRVGYLNSRGQNNPIWIHDNCAGAQVAGNATNEPYQTPGIPAGLGPRDLADVGQLWKMGEACVEPIGDKLGIGDCSENPSKRWVLTFSSADEVSIKNKGSSRCLTINKAENGSPLTLAKCNNLETQMFKYHYGDIVFVDKFCADLNVKWPSLEFDWAANVINLWECAGTWNQKWHFDY